MRSHKEFFSPILSHSKRTFKKFRVPTALWGHFLEIIRYCGAEVEKAGQSRWTKTPCWPAIVWSSDYISRFLLCTYGRSVTHLDCSLKSNRTFKILSIWILNEDVTCLVCLEIFEHESIWGEDYLYLILFSSNKIEDSVCDFKIIIPISKCTLYFAGICWYLNDV